MNDDTVKEGNTAVVNPVSNEAAPTPPLAVPESFALPTTSDRPNEGPVSAQELGNLQPLGQAPTLPTSEAPAFPQATGAETPTPVGQVSENAVAPDFSQAAESATAQPGESSWTPGASPDLPSTNTMGDQVGTGLGAGEERTIEAPTVPGGLPPPAANPQPVAGAVSAKPWWKFW